jgi:hypothetical protein
MKLVGPIANVETIAQGPGIREIGELRKRFGDGSWKKKKGGFKLKVKRWL